MSTRNVLRLASRLVNKYAEEAPLTKRSPSVGLKIAELKKLVSSVETTLMRMEKAGRPIETWDEFDPKELDHILTNAINGIKSIEGYMKALADEAEGPATERQSEEGPPSTQSWLDSDQPPTGPPTRPSSGL